MADTEHYVSCALCSTNFGRMVLVGPTETFAALKTEAMEHLLKVHGAGMWKSIDRPTFVRMWLNETVRSVDAEKGDR